MPPDQPAAPGLTGEAARRWAAVQPASGDARICIGDAPERAELVAGLRSLADYLAADPSVPVPPYGWRVAVYAEGTDSEQFAQVDLVAEITGERPVDRRAVDRPSPCAAFLRAGHLRIHGHIGVADGPAQGGNVVRGLGHPGYACGAACPPGR